MALQANLGMELAVFVIFLAANLLDSVQTVTIVARGGVLVTLGNRFAVHRFHVIGVAIVASGAFGHHLVLVVLPGAMLMNVVVAVSALDFVELVHAGKVVSRFHLVAAHALWLARHHVAGDMFGEVRDFDMAAGASVLAMHRSPILHGGNDPFVAFEAGFRRDGHAGFGLEQSWNQQQGCQCKKGETTTTHGRKPPAREMDVREPEHQLKS
jgi:hypothetical protein